MALWTNDARKMDRADQYFASINPMAAKIIESKKRVIRSFSQGKWDKMSVAEQENEINKSIILPEATSRYKSMLPVTLPEYCTSVFPSMAINTGQKVVKNSEEEWQDEHSSPFSWETKSQMNLTLPQKTIPNSVLKDKNNEIQKGKKEEPPKENLLSKPLKKIEPKAPSAVISNTQHQTIPSKVNHQRISEKAVVTRQPLRHIDSPPDEKFECSESELSKQKYGLISGERKKTSIPMKPKLTSRINPRSSLTLDGAIRNLEVAMKEEEVRKKHFNKNNAQESTTKMQFENCASSSSISSKSENDPVEDAPLLKKKTYIDDDDSIRKSGFDFLDNW
uniref:Uncharacterized protein LOC100178179 n=1 Tax=Phallusia mammillata TaxID=59560 RepID=A0A6F9DHI9_9ASCI|nr:uncharacterized protein LOC100178179 [Phallusia mammillata]